MSTLHPNNTDDPVLLFKQTDQPAVRSGNIAATVTSAVQAGMIVLILYLSTRDNTRRANALEVEGDLQTRVPSLSGSNEKARDSEPSTPSVELESEEKRRV